MATKKAPVKKEPAKKAPAKKAPAKQAAPKKAAAPAKKAPAQKAAAKGPSFPVESIVIPMDVYEPNKDAIKAPIKDLGMKWSYLGEDTEGKKGIYRRDDLNVFAHFKDDGVHYTLRGQNHDEAKKLLAAWRGILGSRAMAAAKEAGAEAAAKQEAAQESEALRLWRLQEPQPRPGEPDFFLQKRKAEWQAKRPKG